MSIIYELDPVGSTRYEQYAGRMQWATIRDGFWVGRENERFSGVIEERWMGGFVATLRDGNQRGPFQTLYEAQACYEADEA